MKFLLPFFRFLFHIGYFGPFVMGVLDSSFLVLPFGNDLVVVSMVARHHHGAPWYVLSAACGSTVGALLLALVARKLGEEGLCRIAGEKRYKKLKDRIGNHAILAVAVAGLAPPPFPFTTVIAAVAALSYPIWRILLVNFLARGLRFTVLAVLALRFGKNIVGITRSAPFEWGMVVFILLCLVASGYSIWQWLRRPSPAQEKKKRKAVA
jgi:membrane protein YqaA with SNARE-associated domain